MTQRRRSPLSRREAERLAMLEPEARARLLARMTPIDLLLFDADFEAWAHGGQIEPAGEGWRTWLMMAGRGYGKTRAGAEWVTRLATRLRGVRIALVAATFADGRNVMVEGESGLLAVGGQRVKDWEPSRGLIRWRGGSEAQIFSAEAPEGLRGPQHHFAWCDELAKWGRPQETWANLQFGLRGGERPRALVTTTPRAVPLIKALQADGAGTVTTRGRSDDNLSLAPAFLEAMARTYAGTLLGRQELDGELIEDAPGALWTRALIERARGGGQAALRRIVIGVDPPAGVGADACGIVICGLDEAGTAHVLADASLAGARPEGWAAAVAAAARSWEADLVVAEANQGGAMVESVLRAADCGLPLRLVHASRGKAARAEPVQLLFAQGRARMAGAFPALEDEMCGMIIGGGYEGPGRSPDRADAMVWAMTELMLKRRAAPRVRAL